MEPISNRGQLGHHSDQWRVAETREGTLRSCGLGTADVSAERPCPVRHSGPWSVFGAEDTPLLHQTVAHRLIHGGFNKRRRDRLSLPVALAVVRDGGLIIAHVPLKLRI